MIEFKDVELNDGDWAKKLLALSDFRGCEYSFGNNFIWKDVYDLKIARYKDFYVIKNMFGFSFPAGSGDVREIVAELRDYCKKEENRVLKFSSMNKTIMEALTEIYGDEIEVTTNRDYYDYIYESGALINLAGKKLHAKRNHLNRFYENDWSFEPVTASNIRECSEMNRLWRIEHDVFSDEEKTKEARAVESGLENFFELGFLGGILRVNGEIQAYTFGERLNGDTFVVHVEKGFTKFQGTYAAINREFVNYVCQSQDYKYINREEDMGAENLRKAKLSYYPAFMEEKFRVSFKD